MKPTKPRSSYSFAVAFDHETPVGFVNDVGRLNLIMDNMLHPSIVPYPHRFRCDAAHCPQQLYVQQPQPAAANLPSMHAPRAINPMTEV